MVFACNRRGKPCLPSLLQTTCCGPFTAAPLAPSSARKPLACQPPPIGRYHCAWCSNLYRCETILAGCCPQGYYRNPGVSYYHCGTTIQGAHAGMSGAVRKALCAHVAKAVGSAATLERVQHLPSALCIALHCQAARADPALQVCSLLTNK